MGRSRYTIRTIKNPVQRQKINPKITSTQVAAEIKEDFGKDVHLKTIKIILHRDNYVETQVTNIYN